MAAPTVYTAAQQQDFLNATSATEFGFPHVPPPLYFVETSPVELGSSTINAAQMVLYDDGGYAVPYLATSGPQSPVDPNQNVSGTITISTTDNFLGLDLGSLLGDQTYVYNVNGIFGTIDLTPGVGTFIGFTDTSPITLTLYDSGPDEIDVLHAFTSVPTSASDVPEPAGWAMMIGGFGMIGAALRRRKLTVSFG